MCLGRPAAECACEDADTPVAVCAGCGAMTDDPSALGTTWGLSDEQAWCPACMARDNTVETRYQVRPHATNARRGQASHLRWRVVDTATMTPVRGLSRNEESAQRRADRFNGGSVVPVLDVQPGPVRLPDLPDVEDGITW